MEINKRQATWLGIGVIVALVVIEFFGAITDGAKADTPGIETTRHGVVVSSTLPHCLNEDGSGYDQTFPCTWNIGSTDGNGRGRAYVLFHVYDYKVRVDFVWNHRPNVNGWRWEGGPESTSDCVVKWIAGRWVERCPDGSRTAYGDH